ncbi:40S ribosomal protein S4, X isoform [Cichlidogyrus casuarinus]|uniref:40S ribosomal protein S4 n=1 Tax=Cichlidogyrus casuarinus TaxID=1844966 RepID=A0ABD2QJC0_9PLAT
MGVRGRRKHLKRLHAPHHWCLSKFGGNYAPRPSCGPHKLRECLPLAIFLRNRLKYALTYDECTKIMAQKLIRVDGKVRTDRRFPAGFMDVISIERTRENFRLIYDIKGRFTVHRIHQDEAKYKLCKVTRSMVGHGAVPYITTHDGRTIRYPNPDIKSNDTIQLDITSGKILNHIKFEPGNVCMITGGHNLGRVGTITQWEKHPGSVEMIHVRDNSGHQFCTPIKNVFIIGKANKAWISLPRGKGIRLSVIEERERRLKARRLHAK